MIGKGFSPKYPKVHSSILKVDLLSFNTLVFAVIIEGREGKKVDITGTAIIINTMALPHCPTHSKNTHKIRLQKPKKKSLTSNF